MSSHAQKVCKQLSDNAKREREAQFEGMEQTQPNEEDSEEEEGDSDVEEVAITLAIIANTDVLYNDVADAWRINIENDNRAIN